MSYTQRHSHESLPPRPRSEYKEKKETYIFFLFLHMLHASLPSHGKETSILVFPSGIVCDGRVSTFLLSHFRVSCFFLSYARLRIRKHATIHARTHTHIHTRMLFSRLPHFLFLSHFSLSLSTQHDFAFTSFLIDRFSHFSRRLVLFFSQSLTHSHARTRFSVAFINKIVCNNV